MLNWNILYPYKNMRMNIRSNIAFRLREFQIEKRKGTSEGEGLYLNVYPESSPFMGSISFLRINMINIPSLISLKPAYSQGSVM